MACATCRSPSELRRRHSAPAGVAAVSRQFPGSAVDGPDLRKPWFCSSSRLSPGWRTLRAGVFGEARRPGQTVLSGQNFAVRPIHAIVRGSVHPGSTSVNPSASSASSRAELTLRGLIIGIVITVLFTAANVFFGLKAGLTFSTSIPAAVISMAILKAMRDATIHENNIVQTVASAAGTLSSIIFVLPGLVILGYWNGFPFWMSFGI